MNSIDWKQKLSSRKLWIAVVGVIVGIATYFGISESDYAQIAGTIIQVASIVGYIAGEAATDIARANNKE